MDDLQTSYENSKNDSLLSGSLRFSTQYVSYFQLYKAVTEWIKEDKNVVAAAIRGGGHGLMVLDFRYDLSEMSMDEQKAILHTVLKPVFKEKLGGDFMPSWDYSTSTNIVK